MAENNWVTVRGVEPISECPGYDSTKLPKLPMAVTDAISLWYRRLLEALPGSLRVSDPIYGTRRWIEGIVIGLNLCPFAQRVFAEEKIRYVLSTARDVTTLLVDLSSELRRLIAEPITSVETALLIHPFVLQDFLDYNEFLAEADQLLGTLKLNGVVQIASFHPAYQFAGTRPDDVENFTNRSPYPMLHLLREESITKISDNPAALEGIPERNIKTMRALGRAKLLEKLKSLET